MKALEFEGRLFPDDRMEMPDEIARQIPAGSDVRVILLWEDGEQDHWRTLSRQRFAGAYAPEDSVYENLIDEPPPR